MPPAIGEPSNRSFPQIGRMPGRRGDCQVLWSETHGTALREVGLMLYGGEVRRAADKRARSPLAARAIIRSSPILRANVLTDPGFDDQGTHTAVEPQGP